MAWLTAGRPASVGQVGILSKNQSPFLGSDWDFVKVILTEIQMMDIRKIPNLKMTNDKAQMSNQAQNPNDKISK